MIEITADNFGPYLADGHTIDVIAPGVADISNWVAEPYVYDDGQCSEGWSMVGSGDGGIRNVARLARESAEIYLNRPGIYLATVPYRRKPTGTDFYADIWMIVRRVRKI